MRTVTTVLFVAVALAVVTVSSHAVQWQVIYQTDFSSDPGWTTNDPTNQYWDTGQGAYHEKIWDTGNQYAYVNVPFESGRSYRLAFDTYLVRADWAGDMRFGLGDADMNVFAPVTFGVGYWTQDFGGQVIGISHFSHESGNGGGDPYVAQFSLNTWYHNDFVYDADAETLCLTVTKVADGTMVGTQTRTGVGDFVGIDRLYISSVGDDYAPGETGEGYIDNVVLSQAVPEPGTLALIAPALLGFAGIVWRRMRRG
jgi:hypothetical protein